MINRAFLGFNICGSRREIESNTIRLHKIDVEIHKHGPNCPYVTTGEIVPFSMEIMNKSEIDLENVEFRDPLQHGLQYVERTFCVDGRPQRPHFHRGVLSYRFPTIKAGAKHRITFDVKVEDHGHGGGGHPGGGSGGPWAGGPGRPGGIRGVSDEQGTSFELDVE